MDDILAWRIYTLADSRTPDVVRYVGITKDEKARLRQHRRPKKSDVSHRAKWVRSVLRHGADIVLRIVDFRQTAEDAEAREIELIASLRLSGCSLVNGTAGGGGLLNPTEDVRRRISSSVLATRTPEFRSRLSCIMSAQMTEARREGLSSAIRAAKQSPASKERDSRAKRNKPPLSNNTGQFKGVSYFKKTGKWGGRIKLDGINRHLGTFPTPEEAARAYDKAAYAAWGSDCYLNFPADMAA